jgi:hypothetical protein
MQPSDQSLAVDVDDKHLTVLIALAQFTLSSTGDLRLTVTDSAGLAVWHDNRSRVRVRADF